MNGKNQESNKACGCCMVNRRQFLAGCASCAAGAAGLTTMMPSKAMAADASAKPRIKLVYTYIPSDRPIWPNIGYDFDRRKKELTEMLSKACPNVTFLPETANNADQAKKIVETTNDQVDGYLIYALGIWTGAVKEFAASGRPMVLVDDLYGGSGEFLIANAAARRANQPVVGISTSRFSDVASVVRCFDVLKKPGAITSDFLSAAKNVRKNKFGKPGDLTCIEDKIKTVDPAECMKKLKASTLIVVGGGNSGWSNSKMCNAIQEVFGTKVVQVEFTELRDAYDKADMDEAAAWADRWMKGAEKIIEPARDEIVRSGAMYLAKRALLDKYNAQGISINCLGGFYGGHITAYPCLGFAQLNNDGLIGACEGDMPSTITMLTMSHLVGRPGFISDPVIDTSKNQIIYAHCVAPTKVFGPSGKSNAYHIRNHSEDRKGAAIRSLMPLGHMTTTLEFHPGKKQVILHQGKSVANIDEDKACRTKLAVEVVGDIDKLMKEWDKWGWHRVTVYGDLKEPVAELAKALMMELIIEA